MREIKRCPHKGRHEAGGTGEGTWGFPQDYESGECYPRKRDIYHKLAELFHTEENYFLNEDEEFLLSAAEKYGAKGAKQAQALVDEVSGLFADGNIADEDLDVMMKALQDAYWIAKEKNKKFTPKKYRRD